MRAMWRQVPGVRMASAGRRRPRLSPTLEAMEGRQLQSVLAAAGGPMPQTREHILLARQVGVPA